MNNQRIDMAYIGREPCGCISVACCVDAPPDAVIEALQEMRRYKLTIELVSNAYVRENPWRCEVCKPPKPVQERLIEVPV